MLHPTFVEHAVEAGSVAFADPSALLLLLRTSTDPSEDTYNLLGYIASNVLTGISFSLVILVGLLQIWCIFKWGAKWMLAMTIGCFTFALGLGLRFGLHFQPDNRTIYIVEYLFVVLSPCAFIAADYVLLSRLSRFLQCERHVIVNPRRITRIFVCSDITTFLIQAAGGGLSTTQNYNMSLAGSHIFLAGLALQLLSFFIFTCVYLLFLYRIHKYERSVWERDCGILPWYKNWLALAATLFLSCIGILIRSVYRTVELSQGYHGYLATTERYFYGLDTLPLFIAIAVYLPFWPGRFISPMCDDRSTRDTRVSAADPNVNELEDKS
ncbi:RTA1-domain-containing protein [Fistulina hepatica ATCC 64428]|nr:RTA1-domain-containing protein [Fistulina hepatica ATCC 64428]